MKKSTIEEIRERFDKDVERFSNLESGQVATVDAQISLEIIAEAARRLRPKAKDVLDLGCGAGNYTLKLLSKLPNLNCYLLDLSKPMLDRAYERVSSQTTAGVYTIQNDIRRENFIGKKFDIILAGAVLHHLRGNRDWERTFEKLFSHLKEGGILLISDLITQETEILNQYIWENYETYLEQIGGKIYANKVLDYIEKEDSPRSLNYQLELMKEVGFSTTEILHKNMCFAAFAGIK